MSTANPSRASPIPILVSQPVLAHRGRPGRVLALMLVAQGALFIWTSDPHRGLDARDLAAPARVLVASDLSAALDTDPAIDIDEYVKDSYSNVFQPFIVLMRDGREVRPITRGIPEDLRNALRMEELRAQLPAGPRVRAAPAVAGRSTPGGPPPFRLGEFARSSSTAPGRDGGRAARPSAMGMVVPRVPPDDGARRGSCCAVGVDRAVRLRPRAAG